MLVPSISFQPEFMTTIDKQRAAELLGKVSERNVVVLGDVMLD